MLDQIFKNIYNILHKDAGCMSTLDILEQTSWVLFLKYLDNLENEDAIAAELKGEAYKKIIDKEFQWRNWAAPKIKNGNEFLEINQNVLTGRDLSAFVNNKLFPYLKRFKQNSKSTETIEYKIGQIFSELKNRVESGYNLREMINQIDEVSFKTLVEKQVLSHFYENLIIEMGKGGLNGGQYYTPRPLIKTMIRVIAPKIGDKIYDGAVGSAGFLCEAFDFLKSGKELSPSDWEVLQKHTLYGKELKPLAYFIGNMNMILHGIDAPNIIKTNTLSENLADIQEKGLFDVVLSNPPFGGKERVEVQQNFPIKTIDTASLFLQHFIKILKAGGRAGIVIKNNFLSDTDLATVAIRKTLLESCHLNTVLDLPKGTFMDPNVKAVVLFFEKGKTTQKIWFYSLNPSRDLCKSNPLIENDFADFAVLANLITENGYGPETENSWNIEVKDIDPKSYDLSLKNPNKNEKTSLL
jgi:type I restriction enzyme M protein